MLQHPRARRRAHLQSLRDIHSGDSVLIGRNPTGTLLIHALHPGRNLHLFGSGTGQAPWLSVTKDPETYERFQRDIACQGKRYVRDLAYRGYLDAELPRHPPLGHLLRDQLRHYPAATREDCVHDERRHCGRSPAGWPAGR